MPSFGKLPWLLWGSSAVVDVNAVAINPQVVTGQLARVAYRRPETWNMFFGARIIGGTPTGAGPMNVIVSFDLFIGVGRSVFSTPPAISASAGEEGFVTFVWVVPPFTDPVTMRPKYTTEGLGPVLNEIDPNSQRPRISRLVAQDIQCKANVIALSAIAGSALVEVTSFFAPNVHVRPDWFRPIQTQKFRDAEATLFSGNEQGGS